MRMAKLPLIGAVLIGLGAVAGCKPEPHVEPQPLYLSVSTQCMMALGARLFEQAPQSVSTDLLVVDVDALAGLEADVVARSSCTSFDVAGDLVRLQQEAFKTILELLDGMPSLPADGRYGLVGGVYFDDPDCAAGGGRPRACGMSGAFGATPPGASGPDAGPDAGVDRLTYWLTCPPIESCLRQEDCGQGFCALGSGMCERDEQCRGLACSDDAVCDEGLCRSPDGVDCIGAPCLPDAVCTGADCVSAAGDPCLPFACQDVVEDEELTPLHPIGHPYCARLYEDATSSD